MAHSEALRPDADGAAVGRAPLLRRTLRLLGVTGALAFALVFLIELGARGALEPTLSFFSLHYRPGWTTVLFCALVLLVADALLARAHLSALALGVAAAALVAASRQKAFYLGAPLFPTDFLFARQVLDIFPLLARQRPVAAAATLGGVVLGLGALVWLWRWARPRLPRLTWPERIVRLAVALPALLALAPAVTDAPYSWLRDQLNIYPLMYDQTENYGYNGFALAFALNLPMARVPAPSGYGADALAALPDPAVPIALPATLPDIVVVMNESYWDLARLPNVVIAPDPQPVTHANLSGHIFSPEFGGLTANIEFEALTGFSNSFLPVGSLPYQQYVRGPLPSLASFLGAHGYATLAVHPNAEWFWNRRTVYGDFGFDRFLSLENLPDLKRRGPLVSDEALSGLIEREVDASAKPMFLFAVTMQNHGAYEPHRYSDPTHTVAGTGLNADGSPSLTEKNQQSLLTYVEGAADADKSLGQLLRWASGRERPTIVAVFGDHLPPLGWVYTDTRFMTDPVPPTREPLADLRLHHETPLVVWSNRAGPLRDVGTISPSFLPLLLLRQAGIAHPYYTGVLGAARERFRVLDRRALVAPDNSGDTDWLRRPLPPDAEALKLLQYDMMFGRRFAQTRFFPDGAPAPVAAAGAGL